MKKSELFIIWFCIILVFITRAALGGVFMSNVQKSDGITFGSDIIAPTPFTQAATSGPFTITTTSQDILATNTARSFVEIRTDTCGGGATLQLDRGIPAVANDGFNIGTTTGLSVFRLTGENLYRGAIAGIAKSGTCVLSVYER